MAGIYIPADLIIARMGKAIGYPVEEILAARESVLDNAIISSLERVLVVLRKGR